MALRVLLVFAGGAAFYELGYAVMPVPDWSRDPLANLRDSTYQQWLAMSRGAA